MVSNNNRDNILRNTGIKFPEIWKHQAIHKIVFLSSGCEILFTLDDRVTS